MSNGIITCKCGHEVADVPEPHPNHWLGGCPACGRSAAFEWIPNAPLQDEGDTDMSKDTHNYATKRVNEAYREATGAKNDIIKPSAKHTPSQGAMKGAKRISDCINVSCGLKSGTEREGETIQLIATIIDEETHVAELLEGHKNIIGQPHDVSKWIDDPDNHYRAGFNDCLTVCKAISEAAIAKAEVKS